MYSLDMNRQNHFQADLRTLFFPRDSSMVRKIAYLYQVAPLMPDLVLSFRFPKVRDAILHTLQLICAPQVNQTKNQKRYSHLQIHRLPAWAVVLI